MHFHFLNFDCFQFTEIVITTKFTKQRLETYDADKERMETLAAEFYHLRLWFTISHPLINIYFPLKDELT